LRIWRLSFADSLIGLLSVSVIEFGVGGRPFEEGECMESDGGEVGRACFGVGVFASPECLGMTL
jgi:hypothetical protein